MSNIFARTGVDISEPLTKQTGDVSSGVEKEQNAVRWRSWMKRVFWILMILALIWGCQKQADSESQSTTATPAGQQAKAGEEGTPGNRSLSPSPRVSEHSKIWLTSATGKPGEQVKLDLYYFLDEPAKTIVVPLTYLGNATIDSFSWVGSDLASYATRPVNVRNDLKIFLAAVVPMTEPDIPADSGFMGTIYFHIDKDAPPQTVSVETTFVYPGNTLSYVDTLIGAVTPQWTAGSIKVEK
jgi:hypothetical protein